MSGCSAPRASGRSRSRVRSGAGIFRSTRRNALGTARKQLLGTCHFRRARNPHIEPAADPQGPLRPHTHCAGNDRGPDAADRRPDRREIQRSRSRGLTTCCDNCQPCRSPVPTLASDVVGYSRLAGADEDRILENGRGPFRRRRDSSATSSFSGRNHAAELDKAPLAGAFHNAPVMHRRSMPAITMVTLTGSSRSPMHSLLRWTTRRRLWQRTFVSILN